MNFNKTTSMKVFIVRCRIYFVAFEFQRKKQMVKSQNLSNLLEYVGKDQFIFDLNCESTVGLGIVIPTVVPFMVQTFILVLI